MRENIVIKENFVGGIEYLHTKQIFSTKKYWALFSAPIFSIHGKKIDEIRVTIEVFSGDEYEILRDKQFMELYIRPIMERKLKERFK